MVGFNATNTGPVWSFTTSTLSVDPSLINYSAIAGYNPADISLVLSGAAPAFVRKSRLPLSSTVQIVTSTFSFFGLRFSGRDH